MDFTVIIPVRQRFGDDDTPLPGEESAPFVGVGKDFEFATPDVDPQTEAVLLFQSYGVSNRNLLTVNGHRIFGDIPIGPEFVAVGLGDQSENLLELPVWNANVLLVSPGVLRDNSENILRIEARDEDGGTDEALDNFIIDNLVILFKTRKRGLGDVYQ